MRRLLRLVILGAVTPSLALLGNAQSEQRVSANSVLDPDNKTSNLSALPPAPKGKSTIMGGEILNLDPVSDQFSLKAFGERPMRIRLTSAPGSIATEREFSYATWAMNVMHRFRPFSTDLMYLL